MSLLRELVSQLDGCLAERDYLRARVAELEAQPLDNRRKLSAPEVRDIRLAHSRGMSQSHLADSYGVNPSTVSRIVRGIYH